MSKRNQKQSNAMYGISRIDDEKHRTHAWRVSLRRQGKMHIKISLIKSMPVSAKRCDSLNNFVMTYCFNTRPQHGSNFVR
jgi:hypothetical protein